MIIIMILLVSCWKTAASSSGCCIGMLAHQYLGDLWSWVAQVEGSMGESNLAIQIPSDTAYPKESHAPVMYSAESAKCSYRKPHRLPTWSSFSNRATKAASTQKLFKLPAVSLFPVYRSCVHRPGTLASIWHSLHLFDLLHSVSEQRRIARRQGIALSPSIMSDTPWDANVDNPSPFNLEKDGVGEVFGSDRRTVGLGILWCIYVVLGGFFFHYWPFTSYLTDRERSVKSWFVFATTMKAATLDLKAASPHHILKNV